MAIISVILAFASVVLDFRDTARHFWLTISMAGSGVAMLVAEVVVTARPIVRAEER